MTTPLNVALYVQDLQRAPRMAGVANPYRDYNPKYDASRSSCDDRAEQLYQYLCARLGKARLALHAEAMGYQGARFSGITLVSERMLLGHHVVPASAVLLTKAVRTSKANADGVPVKGFIEPTGSIVWGEMKRAMVDPYEIVCTNTLPFHPMGSRGPLSNRPPSEAELRATQSLVLQFYALFPDVIIVPLGRVAEAGLRELRIPCQPYVRHPANGGAPAFIKGIQPYWAGLSKVKRFGGL